MRIGQFGRWVRRLGGCNFELIQKFVVVFVGFLWAMNKVKQDGAERDLL